MMSVGTQASAARNRLVLVVGVTVVALVVLLAASRCGGDTTEPEGDVQTAVTGADTTVNDGVTSPSPVADRQVAGAGSDMAGSDVAGSDVAGSDGRTTATTSVVGTANLAAPLGDPEGTGRELAQRFLDILSGPNRSAALEEFLSPAFQLQRANGTYANREEYLADPAVVGNFAIVDSNFRALQDGPVLTVRFSVDVGGSPGAVAGELSRAERLAVFMRTASGWQLVAWSNFNPPAAS